MKRKDRAILDEFAARVREEVDPRARIWAYGSRARGDAAEDSDFDVCVVLPDAVSSDTRQAVRRIAWEISFERGVVILEMLFSAESFERGPMSAHPLVRNILRDGIAA